MENQNSLRLISLLTLILLTKLTTDLCIPALVDMQHSFSATVAEAKMIMSIYMLGFAVSTLICSPFSKKFGIKKTVIACISLYIITSILCVLVNNIYNLLALRFIQALGGGVGTILGRVMVNHYYTGYNKIKILSYFSTLAAITPAIMPIFGGYINEYLGWRYIFVVIAAMGLLALLFTTFTIEDDKGEGKYLLPETLHHYFLLGKNKDFIAIILLNTAAWSSYFIYLNSSSFIYQTVFDLTSVESAAYFALSSMGYIIGSILIRIYSKEFSLETLVFKTAILYLSSAVLLLLYYKFFSINPVGLSISFIFILIPVGIFLPSCQALLLNKFKYSSGDSLSLHFFIQLAVSGGLSIFLNKFSHDIRGTIIYTVVACSIIAFIFAWRIKQASND